MKLLNKEESFMTKKLRNILVTAALPYANGPLHLGHMVEYIQPDIWVRFQRLIGNTCYFVCGDDAHGTPIMLKAEAQNMSPEALIAKYHQEHASDMQDYLIGLDNFYTTHSDENRTLATMIYHRLQQNGKIASKTIQQAFDPIKQMFLPDRYVKGECPKCGAQDQYGDNCEVCGATYSPTELKNPFSVITGATPIEKESEHYFFRLDDFEAFLKDWTKRGHLQPEVSKKLDEWFKAGLKQWDISRDAPYFGFEIPEKPGKYFYVWLDAPIGYMASFKNFCDKQQQKGLPGPTFDDFWQQECENKSELYHFIGKDIVYFHALFWPAILEASEFRTPTGVFVHGFLTINGQKMSKSRGTFINARTYLNYLPAEYLRYYFASKLGSGIEDIDFQIEDFVARINSDIVGKLVNLASRCAGFITERFEGKLSENCEDTALYHSFILAGKEIAESYEKREFRQAIREIMRLADLANRYIDDKKPWTLVKSQNRDDLQAAHEVCSLGLNLFKILMTYLQPVLPQLADSVATFLNTTLTWDGLKKPLLNHPIQPFKPLAQRVDLKQVEAMMDNAKENTDMKDVKDSKPHPQDSAQSESEGVTVKQVTGRLAEHPIKGVINIEEFLKVDLRIAKILNAEAVPEAQKLLKLTVDLGGETRQIFAGIKEAYAPEDLIGKLTIVVANLAPRKMRFGVSEGMVAIAVGSGVDGKKLFLLEPHEGAEPGMQVQ